MAFYSDTYWLSNKEITADLELAKPVTRKFLTWTAQVALDSIKRHLLKSLNALSSDLLCKYKEPVLSESELLYTFAMLITFFEFGLPLLFIRFKLP